MKDVIISPSVLGADFLNFEKEIQKIKDLGVKWIHFDVMDGRFVDNISFGNIFLKRVNDQIDLVKDVHIMIEDPLSKVEKFAESGADYLTFHYEACRDDKQVFEVIDKIHACGMKAGLSVKPNTAISKVFPFLHSLDLVLIMSVEPGRGGQPFIDLSLNKIFALRQKIEEERVPTLISVDGGINDVTAKDCLTAGVDVLVVGQYLFGHEDFEERYKRLFE